MAIKINSLEVENVKRIKAVKIEPSINGLIVIGGNNNQGKTSVLDSIAWALGGDRFRPSQAQREGSILPPSLHVELSNGIVVERKGKNSDLKVIDPTGRKGGQQLLNEFTEALALDLPKFMNASNKEKAQTLLQIIGVGNKLYELEKQETELYNKRHAIGQIAEQKQKFADEMVSYPDVPKEPVSASDLIKQQQDILARNGENQRKRAQAARLRAEAEALEQKISETNKQLTELMKAQEVLERDLRVAELSAEALRDESTEELETNLREIEMLNIKIRSNLDKEKASEEAKMFKDNYGALSDELNEVRKQKTELLNNAELPLPGLSVEEGELTYNGFKWDNLSGSDQLRVATAIVRKLNPKCGFVLLDKLEQMDVNTLNNFGTWLEQEGLQAIATRVSTGDECSIIIEDGYSKGSGEPRYYFGA